jgi:hypothetical protein
MKKIKLPINNNEKRIILNALIEFRNNLLKEKRYTDSVDELILKISK